MGLNMSLLNISSTGGFTPAEAAQYVTIESCKNAFKYLQFENWFLSGFIILLLLVIAWLWYGLFKKEDD